MYGTHAFLTDTLAAGETFGVAHSFTVPIAEA